MDTLAAFLYNKFTDLPRSSNHKEESSSKERCKHPISFGTECIVCGQNVDKKSNVSFGYIFKGLRLAHDEIARLRNEYTKTLLGQKKLCLVLDLDNTLLHSIELEDLTPDEKYLESRMDSLQDVSKVNLVTADMIVKLRPFVREFLKEASQMFEMYIYTMGSRSYAEEIAELLDPGIEYFRRRIISRDDGTQCDRKSLDVVLGQETAVLILDDIKKVWTKHEDNLILMERYDFFASSLRLLNINVKSLSERKVDESESKGALATILQVLRKIHHMFFEELKENLESRDVRQVLKTVRKDVLKGCKIVFSFSTKSKDNHHAFCKMAEELGATCCTEVDPSVTHVVSRFMKPNKNSRWALENNKFLVHPSWIKAANQLWQKPPEEKFPSVNLIQDLAHFFPTEEDMEQ